MHFKFQLLCHSEQGFKTKPSINVTENLLFVFRGMIQQVVNTFVCDKPRQCVRASKVNSKGSYLSDQRV